MRAEAQPTELPLVDTSIVRLMTARMRITHEERAISVISGPWGIGKTTAIDAFAGADETPCAVIKIEPPARKSGTPAAMVMRLVLESLRAMNGYERGAILSNSTWTLRSMIYNELARLFEADDPGAHFTFIFDEAQYLSRESIEMLRYWNDRDRTTTPFPVGLIFVGNNEFAMAESLGGESVLSGAVRSRLLFEEALSYTHLDDTDLTLFCQSRGIEQADAIAAIVGYYSSSSRKGQRGGQKRDLRHVERTLSILRRRAGDEPVTGATVAAYLGGW